MAKNIPEDEMDLACAIAETHARGLKAVVGNYYQAADGTHTLSFHDPIYGDAVACCAAGALALCLGSLNAVRTKYPGIIQGHDLGDGPALDAPDASSGITVGAAYAHALDLLRASGPAE